MRRRLIWVFMALLISFASAATAQTATGDELYRIQPGDVVAIVVYGQPDLTLDVLVLPDGTISYPFAGTIQVRDLTPGQVEEHITTLLSAVIRTPIVSVQVQPGRGPSVVILGEVRTPGVYPIAGETIALLEAIALAGGTTPTADLAKVKVYDRGNIRDYKEAPIGVQGVLFEGEATENPAVTAGNIIYVPPSEAENEIYILGEVQGSRRLHARSESESPGEAARHHRPSGRDDSYCGSGQGEGVRPGQYPRLTKKRPSGLKASSLRARRRRTRR